MCCNSPTYPITLNCRQAAFVLGGRKHVVIVLNIACNYSYGWMSVHFVFIEELLTTSLLQNDWKSLLTSTTYIKDHCDLELRKLFDDKCLFFVRRNINVRKTIVKAPPSVAVSGVVVRRQKLGHNLRITWNFSQTLIWWLLLNLVAVGKLRCLLTTLVTLIYEISIYFA